MRILILSWKDLTHPAAGGAEVFTEEVARSLVRRGHQVTLFASAVEGEPGRETVDGVDVVRRGSRLGVYRAARRFWSAQRSSSYDVVVDEINTRPFLTPRWIGNTPVVTLIYQLAREVWFFETPFPISVLGRYVLEPWWLRSYRDVPAMTISASSARSLVDHHGWRDVKVIPVGLAPHSVPRVPKEDAPTVAFLGRLVAMKRPGDAIEAFRLVSELLPSARLWIIGEGPLRVRLARSAPTGVEFLGRVPGDELLERLARAHVLVCTSVREGWGLNVSEAALCGTPSIAYGAPGLVDSVEAAGGLVVEGHPRALARAVLDFFAGQVRLEPRVGTVSWDRVADAVEARLEGVIRSSSEP